MSMLSELIRAVLAETDLVSPDDVADEVVRRTPPESVLSFYREAVRDPVRIRMHHVPVPIDFLPDQMRSDTHTMYVGQEQTTPPANPSATPSAIPLAGSNYSAKRAAIADMWRTYLRERVSVRNEWKWFGDCTYDDVMALVNERRTLAAANSAKADQYERVAKEMLNLGADRVSDLPEAIGRTAWDGE